MAVTRQRVSRVGDLYTVPAMAEALGIAPDTLSEWMRRHGTKVVKLGHTPLVSLRDLDDFKCKLGIARELLGVDGE